MYTLLAGRADKDDRMLTAVQLMKNVEDLDGSIQRDALDSSLGAPMGEDAEDMTRLLQFLKGE